MRRYLRTILVIATMGASAACGVLTSLRKPEPGIPTVRVVHEPVEVIVHALGELRPARTAMMVAPPVAGGTLQIVHIVKTGTIVQQNDVVVEFDPSEQEYNLEQSRSQLEEVDQQIRKMKADQAVRAAQDKVSLLRAQFDVRRAELTVKGNELLSGIEARKNEIALEESRRRLEQLQRDIQSRASSDQADQAVQAASRTKAMLGMKLAQQNIDNMTLRAPIGGVVVLGQNLESLMSASGSISISSGMEIPEYREGDQAYPGRLIAQIQDMDKMEILSKVTENDRGGLTAGQPINVRVDSEPLRVFSGRIKSLAESASTGTMSSYLDYLEMLSTRSFDVTFEMDADGARLNPGVTTRVTVRGASLNNALSLPRQALFQKEGKQVVYVRSAAGWEAQDIQVKHLTESRAVIEGLPEGTEVALVNPELQRGKAAGKAGPLSSILGGSQ
ncbi:MAG: copper/silver efflux system rane fusion protein CusB [Acidobacteria bacterium]|nr:copper/silver efflux system rane fusion protein CusB [Acidobacteriota bacterium]